MTAKLRFVINAAGLLKVQYYYYSICNATKIKLEFQAWKRELCDFLGVLTNQTKALEKVVVLGDH